MFDVHKPQLDWLTLTTWSDDHAHAMYQFANQWGVARKEAKRMQYTGFITHDRSGSLFCGVGRQRNRDHFMLQASGKASNQVFRRFSDAIGGGIRCTRLDAQLTVEYPRLTWSQTALFQRLRDANEHRSISYAESQSGPAGSKLATVYFGSRSSDRLVRIYEKQGLGDEVFLRFEVEFKGKRAMVAATDLADHPNARCASILRHEVKRVGDPDIINLFSPHLAGFEAHEVRTVSEQGNTIRWLLETVAPSLDRVLQDHNLDASEVYETISKIMGDAKHYH